MTSTSVATRNEYNASEVAAYYAARVPTLAQRGGEWRGPCPVHGGNGDNFTVNADSGCWCCHSQCGRGGSMYDLEMALSNTGFNEAANEVRRIVGRPCTTGAEQAPEAKWGLPRWSIAYLQERIGKIEQHNRWTHAATYPYFTPDGQLSYVKVRFRDKQNDKTFRQYAPSPKLGWITRNKAVVAPLLYRANKLASADEVFIVNGEKAADRRADELGIVTTCAPDGEGKWWGEYTELLVGKRVRIIIDNDAKGDKHGELLLTAIAPHVPELKILRLPALPPKGDLWDWIEAGGTREELDEIVARTHPEPIPAEASTTAALGPPRQKAAAIKTTKPVKTNKQHPSLVSQLRNDTGNADRLIAFCGHDIRYCPALRKWLVWDGRRWAVDERGAVRQLAKRTMLEFLSQAADTGDSDLAQFAHSSLDARRIANMISLAECELVIMPSHLDTHPFLLNFLNGTVDLTTGELRPHGREQYLTKLVHHNYNPQAECPLFLQFIGRIMGGHADAAEPELDRADRMVAYLQRALGYSMTGTTEEKAVFVPFGSGNNGKTTLLATFLQLLEEYSVLLQVDTLMTRQESNNTQADLDNACAYGLYVVGWFVCDQWRDESRKSATPAMSLDDARAYFAEQATDISNDVRKVAAFVANCALR